MWRILLIMVLVGPLVACNGEQEAADQNRDQDKSQEESFYEPLEYSSDKAIERRGKIPTGKDSYFKRTAEDEFRNSKYGQTNRSHDNVFNDEEAMAIMEKVNELEEVTLTQAYSTDDHVYVAVMVNPYDRRDQSVTEKVQAKVKEITDKPISIYTNNNNWDHMKDMNARLKASKAPDDLKKRIKDFFNQNR
ncbi:YhcN/YlaJ family sporulation lipoprotein [Halobacillus mangrovi]|uniref:Sporulation protein n=1 Tax=Halobacillus mangrovi TaxID=402384 RepID=A0A1W5ZUJ6_9BACI|nr:YhcN/YlaJ family sporulation lipoprotein [Halobacillus mangrovi]ARI76943.1 hypothetical protein HM131_08850 [Halobacillus mangrovi]